MAEDGKVVAEIALPVAGLMSDQSYETVRETLIPLRKAAKIAWRHARRAVPAQLAFLPLAGDPASQDLGPRQVIDVDAFEIIDP